MRVTDWSVVRVDQIPRIKLEYQVNRPLFVRVVGQYVASKQAPLRDDARTGDPILIRNDEGVYERTSRIRANGLRFDWLLSYQPSPGTVVFAGYGGTMDEPRAFRFSGMERTNDGFFLKLSYLFRL